MSQGIFRVLASRYMLPEWVLVPQVRDGTGFSSSRTADAVAMNCYPSKGLEIHGFEFKIARSDWLRELRDGGKAETVARHCDRWWIVATEGVVVRAELPKSWGLIVCKTGEDDSLRTVVTAPPLPCSNEAGPIDRSFIASFVRGCLERAKKPSDEEIANAKHAGRKEVEARVRREDVAATERREKAEGRWELAVKTFENASGVRIDEWGAGRVGEEFAAFQRFRNDIDRAGLRRQAARIREIAEAMESLAGLPADAKAATPTSDGDRG